MAAATSNARTIIGVFDDEKDAQDAVRDLKLAGFREPHIGLAASTRDESAVFTDSSTKAAAAGAIAGLGTGALWGLGIVAGLLPGIGPAVAAGSLVGILSSATVGAAAGGLGGALVGLGISGEDAAHYENQFRAGKIVIAVQADDRAGVARAIMDRYRAAGL